MKSNFYYSFFFLPPREKQALIHFYSFCRLLDDEIDRESASHSVAWKMEWIQTWRAEIKNTFNGRPAHPLTRKLWPHIRQYALSPLYFDEILNGMEMDILKSSYATFEELKLYCYRVASAVGLVCMEIFGERSERANEGAIDLGIAFQLTNILRDIFSDLKRGRVYLPQEDFIKFSYSEEDLRRHFKSEAFKKLIEFEIRRAKSYYQKAEEELRVCRFTGKNVIRAMSETYYQLLLKIEKNIFQLDTPKELSLSFIKRLSIAGTIWLGNLKKEEEKRKFRL